MASLIDDLWLELDKLEPSSKLGGIYANKRGYHNKRSNLPSTDYSVGQFVVDTQGPSDEGSAIDWTFPDAQAGNYRTIAKYSRRLLAAGKANDPRTKYMREFFGNTDDDREVEGYDFSKERDASSDSSHLWHIHISIHRKYINDPQMVRAIISILKGETIEQWLNGGGVPAVPKPTIPSPLKTWRMPVWSLERTAFFTPWYPKWRAAPRGTKVFRLSDGQDTPYRQTVQSMQRCFIRLGLMNPGEDDGKFGPYTHSVVLKFQRQHRDLDDDGLLGMLTYNKGGAELIRTGR